MQKVSVLILILIFVLVGSVTADAQLHENFQQLIDQGEFTQAQKLMRQELATNLNMDPLQRLEIAFQIERLDRIKKDFKKTEEDILNYIKQYVPDVTATDLAHWEKEKSLEFMMIDGKKKYFNWAGENLFRINKKLMQIKAKKGEPGTPLPYNKFEDVQKIVQSSTETGKKFINPVKVKVTYTLTTKKDVVPHGKITRCWLPFPREIPGRQTEVKLISCVPERHIIAPNEDYLQRTIYLEKPAVAGEGTMFQVVFEFTNHAVYQKIDPQVIGLVNPMSDLAPYLKQQPPHIVFTPELKELSEKIVGEETNPYFIARKIFQWVDENIPWTSAREYSTFSNISDYVYQNRRGDCGMKVFLFMTLCRMNWIPTRWQSGFTTKAGVAYRATAGMHDWGEIYIEPYGWLPVDPDVGLVKSKNEDEKWFFIGGMDAYRLIINDDYAQDLYPAKIHFRSETLDFQRGEVEWEGGNLYFDQWDWDYNVELLN